MLQEGLLEFVSTLETVQDMPQMLELLDSHLSIVIRQNTGGLIFFILLAESRSVDTSGETRLRLLAPLLTVLQPPVQRVVQIGLLADCLLGVHLLTDLVLLDALYTGVVVGLGIQYSLDYLLSVDLLDWLRHTTRVSQLSPLCPSDLYRVVRLGSTYLLEVDVVVGLEGGDHTLLIGGKEVLLLLDLLLREHFLLP